MTILDLCCGSCSAAIAAACYGLDSYFIDLDENQLKSAAKNIKMLAIGKFKNEMELSLKQGLGAFTKKVVRGKGKKNKADSNTTVTEQQSTPTLILSSSSANSNTTVTEQLSTPTSILSSSSANSNTTVTEQQTTPNLLPTSMPFSDLIPRSPVIIDSAILDQLALSLDQPKEVNNDQSLLCTYCGASGDDLMTCIIKQVKTIICRKFTCKIKHHKQVSHASAK